MSGVLGWPSRAVTRLRIYVPVGESSLQALLAGDRKALQQDPVLAEMHRIIREQPALGDFGIYDGVAEIGLGWETFAPTDAAQPTLGAAGETSVSPTVTLTTWIDPAAPADVVEDALAALMAAHPWEVPVIELTETRMLLRR
ncbi:hypothetical protein [Novosphingobium sp.]|uniref:hypothetical protein n=1 Tax=Novosphingobium sp. TaxID=1874826 RepID=UPI0038B6B81C